MTGKKNSTDALQVALLMVVLEEEAVDAVRQAAAEMHWALVPLKFDKYFSTARGPHLTQQAILSQACLALIDFDRDPELALYTAEFLRHSFYQKIAIVGLSSHEDPELLLKAMRAGCSEFLTKPLDMDEFADTLARLDRHWSMRSARQENTGRLLSFFGAKGGVGTTTLAVHLAISLVSVSKKKVLLIDNHAQLGHVCLYLGLDGNRYHFAELVRNVSRLDQDLLRGFIATHSSGLDVLSSPDAYGSARNTDDEAVARTLDFLSAAYDFVLLDCEASFDHGNLSVVQASSQVYLVSTPEIGSIRDLSRYVDGLTQNEQATEKLQVIVNRYSSREAISIEQIEKAMRLPVAIKIPNQYSEVVSSINAGEPLAPGGKSQFSVQIREWAIALGGDAQSDSRPARKSFAPWK